MARNRTTATLDAETIKIFKWFGGGHFSTGVTRAINLPEIEILIPAIHLTPQQKRRGLREKWLKENAYGLSEEGVIGSLMDGSAEIIWKTPPLVGRGNRPDGNIMPAIIFLNDAEKTKYALIGHGNVSDGIRAVGMYLKELTGK